ncbi:hypothetical protein KUTG_00706 [Kutzneria sp. 744]|nr:hypothetical protein KUTG_00706 [Kutzneria sp. 744]
MGTSTITTANPTQPQPAPENTTTAPRPAGTQVRAAGKCLDVPNSTTTPGTQLQIWSCSGRPNQAWSRTPSCLWFATFELPERTSVFGAGFGVDIANISVITIGRDPTESRRCNGETG